MRLRITKVDEYQFLSCLKHSLWGSKSARFKDWQKGDYLVFIVDKALSGYTEVSGEPFQSNEKVWDDGLFPYRIPIKFCQILAKNDRIPILGEIRNVLVSKWGNRYGWGILNQQLITNSTAEKLINAFTSRPNNLIQTESSLEQFLQEADQQRKNNLTIKKVRRLPPIDVEPPLEKSTSEEDSTHSKAQNALITLGRITGCSVGSRQMIELVLLMVKR